jgi:hypothetical protein
VSRRLRPLVLGSALLALGGTAVVLGQRQPLPPPGQAAPPVDPHVVARVSALEEALAPLLRLPGTWVEVRYPAETLDRAARVQARLEALVELWQPISPSPLAWHAATVTEEIWGRLPTGRPWGMPVLLEGTFVVPAYGDAGTVATASRLLGGPVPAAAGTPSFGTAEEAGSLVLADVVLQLEAARLLVETAGFRCEEPWICGVLAHLAARLAWEMIEPDRTLEIVALLDRAGAALGGPRARRLEEYRPGLDFETDLWFHAQLVRGADPIWVDQGRLGTPRRMRRWLKQKEPVGRAALDKEFPGIAEWRAAAFAP